MNAILRHTMTIQPQEAPQAPALADLIPARARALGCTDFESYCDLIDRAATAHLSGGYLARVSRIRQLRRPRPYFDRSTGTHCLSVCLNNNRTMFGKAEASDWIAIQEMGADGVWLAADNGRGFISVVTKLLMRSECVANTLTVARLILGLGPNEQAGFADGDSLNLRRSNLFAITRTKPKGTLRRPRYDARDVAHEAAARRDQMVSEGRTFDPLS